MLLLNDKPFITLDNYLDINHFLSLKDDFYFMFCNNLERSKATWNAAGIPIDCKWEYLMEQPFLYFAKHAAKDDPNIEKFKTRDGLAKYLQLKYNAFNPYTFMHLSEKNKPYFDFVPESIQSWAKSLPYERHDLISVIFNEHYIPLRYHRDFNFFPIEEGDKPQIPDTLQDVIWLRFELDRDLFLYDFDDAGNILNKARFEGYSVNFNHYNWHGNTEASDKCSMTIKVEGKFTDEFRKKIYV